MSDSFTDATLKRILAREQARALSRLGVAQQASPEQRRFAGAAPPVVTGLRGDFTVGAVTIRWNDVAFSPRPRYRVQMAQSLQFTSAIEVLTFNDHVVWTDDLVTGATYYVRVRAESGAGFSQIGPYGSVLEVDPDTGDFISLEALSAALGGTSKTIAIVSPTTDVDYPVHLFTEAVTITAVHAIVAGTSPSVTIDPQHSEDNSALRDILASPTAITSTSTGQTLTSFDDPTIPAGSWLRPKITAVSGTVKVVVMQFFYDPG